MGDALSLGELRAVVFGVLVISIFSLTVGLMPHAFTDPIDRRKVNTPLTDFDAISVARYVNYTSFLMNGTGSETFVWMDLKQSGGGSGTPFDHLIFEASISSQCIRLSPVSSMYFFEWEISETRMPSYEWIDPETGITKSTLIRDYYCGGYLALGFQHHLTGPALNTAWDTEKRQSGFIAKNGQNAIEVYFTWNQTLGYSTPVQAWTAGDLQVFIGLTFEPYATGQNGLELIIAFLFFQPVTGLPDSIAYIFSVTLWTLIALITFGLFRSIIPLL